jgi:aryl-alcohol dehydrogenase-like predicted oxidoreductase
MAKTGLRDDIVLATKYTAVYKGLHDKRMRSNYGGNSAKSLHVSVEDSLKKLQTSYIDLVCRFFSESQPAARLRNWTDIVPIAQLYVHFWDMTTSIPEIMQSLNHLVATRKVLYLGISDTPAWIVVKCNAYAREHGLRQFSVYQGKWSAAERDFERDIIPMCMDEGMSLAPWGALGSGYFKPKELVHNDGGRNLTHIRSKPAEQVSEVLEKIAKRKNTLITSVALAYVMRKSPYVFPICGGRKVEHLKGNIEALGLQLDDADIEEIEGAYDFDVGFPHNMLSGGPNAAKGPGDNVMSKRLGHFDYVKGPQPIAPHVE